MHATRRTLLFTVVLLCFGGTTLLAQRGAVGARAPLPSSTALGAGALSSFPSSTSHSTGPSFAGNGYGRGRAYTGGNRAGNGRYGTPYRPLPRNYVVAPFYYPYFDWSGGTDYSNAPPPDDYGQGYAADQPTDQMMANQAALGQQVQRLTAQLNGLMYGQGYPQQPAADQQQTPAPPPVTLVLRSGQTLKVENYAVSGNSFWDFSQNGTHKIPLSSIDLAASAKATEENGGEFPQMDGAR